MATRVALATWRPAGYVRTATVVGLVPLALLLVILVVTDPAGWGFYLALVVVIAYAVGELRRRCELTDSELIARGRISTRVIPLADLQQVARSNIATFVQLRTVRFRGNDICQLRMIPVFAFESSSSSASKAVDTIRAQAVRAGATLEPLPEQLTRLRMSKPSVFGY